jgi:hypothetical protein
VQRAAARPPARFDQPTQRTCSTTIWIAPAEEEMAMRERESLIARIRHMRRVNAPAEARALDPTEDRQSPPEGGQSDRIRSLERRIEHLEKLVEGFQDSVHRETERQDRLITELQAQVQPATMGAALSRDARDRGL